MTASVFIGGVDVSWSCLKALCEKGHVPGLVFSYDASLSHRAGYRDFADLQAIYKFDWVRTADINVSSHKELMAKMEPSIIWIIGWSQLADRELLSIPSQGCVGIHPTRLPEGRGRAPIPWTLIHGLKSSAVTMLFLNEKADAGDIIDQKEFKVEWEDDARSLYDKVQKLHVDLIRDNVDALMKGTPSRHSQNSQGVTVWPKRSPDDGRIVWNSPAETLYNWIRGLTHPYPGAFTFYNNRKCFIWKAEWLKGNLSGTSSPGMLSAEVVGTGTDGGGALVQTADAALLVKTAQWEGDGELPVRDMLKNGSLKIGGRFD